MLTTLTLALNFFGWYVAAQKIDHISRSLNICLLNTRASTLFTSVLVSQCLP